MLVFQILKTPNFNACNNSDIDKIKHAIKDSRPKLLEKALHNIKLKEQDKENLLFLAFSIAKTRENRMNIELIKPKPKPIPTDSAIYDLMKLSIIITTPITSLLLCTKFFSMTFDWDESIEKPLAIATIVGAVLLYKKLDLIAKKKDQEFFQHYRTTQQEYIDSIDIIAILQSN